VSAGMDMGRVGPQMTLAEAFSIVTGATADRPADEREEAMVLVYEELHRLARRLRVDRDIQEESASYGFQRLVLGGPRAIEHHDAVTQTYLWRIVCSISRDLIRKKGREVSTDFGDADASANATRLEEDDPETLLVSDENRRNQASQRQWVLRYVFTEVTRMVSERIASRYREDFVQSMSQFERLVGGLSTIDDLVQHTFGGITPTTRDRLYQRHSRARRRIFEWVQEELPTLEGLLPEQKQLVRNLVSQFRR